VRFEPKTLSVESVVPNDYTTLFYTIHAV